MLTQLRLAVAGVILLAFLAVGSTALWYRGNAIEAQAERDKAVRDLGVVVGANKVQEETIGRMRAEADFKDRLVAKLAGDVAAINDNLAKTTRDLAELKDADPAVHDYLDTPVPDALRRMYDRRPAAGHR